MVAAMRDRIVALADFEARRAAVDEEAGDQLLGPARRVFLAGGDEDDDEIGDVGVRNEVLGAVDDPVVAVLLRKAFHAAHVGAGVRLGHGQRIELVSAHGRQQVALALLVIAAHQDAGGAAEIGGEGERAAAKLALDQREGNVIEATAADVLRKGAAEEAEFLALAGDFRADFRAHDAGALDFVLMRIDFGFDEIAHGLDDHFLFVGQSEIHGCSPSFTAAAALFRFAHPGIFNGISLLPTSRRRVLSSMLAPVLSASGRPRGRRLPGAAALHGPR